MNQNNQPRRSDRLVDHHLLPMQDFGGDWNEYAPRPYEVNGFFDERAELMNETSMYGGPFVQRVGPIIDRARTAIKNSVSVQKDYAVNLLLTVRNEYNALRILGLRQFRGHLGLAELNDFPKANQGPVAETKGENDALIHMGTFDRTMKSNILAAEERARELDEDDNGNVDKQAITDIVDWLYCRWGDDNRDKWLIDTCGRYDMGD